MAYAKNRAERGARERAPRERGEVVQVDAHPADELFVLRVCVRVVFAVACCSCSRLPIDPNSRWQIPRTRAHIAIVDDWLKSAVSRPTFGPLMADTERTHPLGKEIRIRIDRERVPLRTY